VQDRSTVPAIKNTITTWWHENAVRVGSFETLRRFVIGMYDFFLDSMPEMRQRRFGDLDYDFDFRVNTTAGTVGWRDRLLGVFHSPYQATDPDLFREMMAILPEDITSFVFIDIGSGKGRALLMASDYPFKKILGVELLPGLNRVALQNIRHYKSASQRCADIDSVCADARVFTFPADPLVVYLFNPLPECGLVDLMNHLSESVVRNPREVWVLYHNPILEPVLESIPALQKVSGTAQYVLYHSNAGS